MLDSQKALQEMLPDETSITADVNSSLFQITLDPTSPQYQAMKTTLDSVMMKYREENGVLVVTYDPASLFNMDSFIFLNEYKKNERAAIRKAEGKEKLVGLFKYKPQSPVMQEIFAKLKEARDLSRVPGGENHMLHAEFYAEKFEILDKQRKSESEMRQAIKEILQEMAQLKDKDARVIAFDAAQLLKAIEAIPVKASARKGVLFSDESTTSQEKSSYSSAPPRPNIKKTPMEKQGLLSDVTMTHAENYLESLSKEELKENYRDRFKEKLVFLSLPGTAVQAQITVDPKSNKYKVYLSYETELLSQFNPQYKSKIAKATEDKAEFTANEIQEMAQKYNEKIKPEEREEKGKPKL